jgi:hypothetical protein
VIATHQSLLLGLDEVFGVKYKGKSHYSVDYIRLISDVFRSSNRNHDWVVYDRFFNVEVNDHGNVEILAKTIHPDVERTPIQYVSHFHSPPNEEADFPSIVSNRYGQGRIVYVSAPIFKTYLENGNKVYREIVDDLLRFLIPEEERIIETDAPSAVEISVMQQKDRLVIHLLAFASGRPGNHNVVIEEIPEVRDVHLKVKKTFNLVKVYLVPSQEPLEWHVKDGFILIIVKKFHIHQMMVIERL